MEVACCPCSTRLRRREAEVSQKSFTGRMSGQCIGTRLMADDEVASRLILVLEADPAVQRHLGSLLANLGYEPVITGSVAESLAALAGNQFQLSLVNFNLDRADGSD